jgi:hypothetical protein
MKLKIIYLIININKISFFKDVEPEYYKEYIDFNTLTKQKQYTSYTFNFTEINKVDLSLFFKKIKEQYKELNIKNFKIKIRSKENYEIYNKSRFAVNFCLGFFLFHKFGCSFHNAYFP